MTKFDLQRVSSVLRPRLFLDSVIEVNPAEGNKQGAIDHKLRPWGRLLCDGKNVYVSVILCILILNSERDYREEIRTCQCSKVVVK